MKMKDSVSRERLMQVLRYDPKTGLFYHRERRREEFRTPQAFGSFLSKTKGRPAGARDGSGYWRIVVDRVSYAAHRLAWLYVYGKWPDGEIDHINGDRADNCISNLRDVQPVDNQRNRRLQSNNSTGASGVTFDPRRGKFYARIWVYGKRVSLGGHVSFAEAVAARQAAERKYGFHPNHGRAV